MMKKYKEVAEDTILYGTGYLVYTRTKEGVFESKRLDPRKVFILDDNLKYERGWFYMTNIEKAMLVICVVQFVLLGLSRIYR